MRVGAVQVQVQWFACAWRGWRACSGAYMRTTHHVRHCCAQNADHLAHGSPLSASFAEVVCSLAATPPPVGAWPPPNGGNGVIRGVTRRRHAASHLLMLQNPHRHRCGRRRRDWRAWLRCPWAVAGPGRASRRRAERSSRRGRRAGGPPPTGTPSSPARQGIQSSPERSGSTQQGARSAAAPRAPRVCQLLTG